MVTQEICPEFFVTSVFDPCIGSTTTTTTTTNNNNNNNNGYERNAI